MHMNRVHIFPTSYCGEIAKQQPSSSSPHLLCVRSRAEEAITASLNIVSDFFVNKISVFNFD